MQLIATLIVSFLIAVFVAFPVQSGERRTPVNGVHRLTPNQDDFYAKFGGRVFLLWCGKRQHYVFKRADGRGGFFRCTNRATSANAYMVQQTKRGWQRVR